jgi:biotin operon repressor
MKYREGIWSKIPMEILLDQDLTRIHLAVYGYISNRQGAALNTWVSREDIAKDIGIAEETVSRAVSVLEKKGWLDVDRRGLGKTNVYQALIVAYEPLKELKKTKPKGDESITSRKAKVEIDNSIRNDLPVMSGSDQTVTSGSDQVVTSLIYKEPSEIEPYNSAPTVAPEKPLEWHLCNEMHQVQKLSRWDIEMKTAKQIVAGVKNLDQDPLGALKKILTEFHKLRRSGDKYWAGQPFTPRGLSPNIDRIWAIVLKNQETPSGWGLTDDD